ELIAKYCTGDSSSLYSSKKFSIISSGLYGYIYSSSTKLSNELTCTMSAVNISASFSRTNFSSISPCSSLYDSRSIPGYFSSKRYFTFLNLLPFEYTTTFPSSFAFSYNSSLDSVSNIPLFSAHSSSSAFASSFELQPETTNILNIRINISEKTFLNFILALRNVSIKTFAYYFKNSYYRLTETKVSRKHSYWLRFQLSPN